MFVRLVARLFDGCLQMNFTQQYGNVLVVGTRELKDAKRNGGGRSVVDREKVIKGLECCIIRDPDDKMRCSECPYNEPDTYCLNRLKMDVLVLLKAQEPVLPELDNLWKHTYGRCGVCRAPLPSIEGLVSKFCWMCGRAVKWNG